MLLFPQSADVADYVKRRETAAEDNYRKLFQEFLFVEDPKEFPPSKFTLSEWKWALAILWSRSFSVFLPEVDVGFRSYSK